MASVDKLGSGRWQARWRDPDGKQRKRSFPRKSDAERFLTGVESRLLDGSYVDPARARITVGEWATRWYAGRVNLKPKTLASYDSLLSRRIRPTWETTRCAGSSIPPSSREWLRLWLMAFRRRGHGRRTTC